MVEGRDKRSPEASKAFELAAQKVNSAIEQLPEPERMAILDWYFERPLWDYFDGGFLRRMDKEEAHS